MTTMTGDEPSTPTSSIEITMICDGQTFTFTVSEFVGYLYDCGDATLAQAIRKAVRNGENPIDLLIDGFEYKRRALAHARYHEARLG